LQDVAPFVLNGPLTINDSPARPGLVYARFQRYADAQKPLSNIFARRLSEFRQHSYLVRRYADPDHRGILRSAKSCYSVSGSILTNRRKLWRCHNRTIFNSISDPPASRRIARRLRRHNWAEEKSALHGYPPAVEWMRARLAGEFTQL